MTQLTRTMECLEQALKMFGISGQFAADLFSVARGDEGCYRALRRFNEIVIQPKGLGLLANIGKEVSILTSTRRVTLKRSGDLFTVEFFDAEYRKAA